MLSTESRILAAILLIAVPTVEFGGLGLLAMLTRRDPGYLENPLRQGMFRAGHAHADHTSVVGRPDVGEIPTEACPPAGRGYRVPP